MNEQELAEYISGLKKNSIDIITLDPIPKPQIQKGGTCGYYAMSIITSYWHSKYENAPFFYARKSDYPDKASTDTATKSSLRQMGKSKIPTMDAIFDVYLFEKVFEEAGYRSSVYKFDTLFDFSIIVKKALESGFPIILPIDLVIAMGDVSKAHYVTLVGLIRKNDGQSKCIFSSDGKYYQASLLLICLTLV